MNVCPRCRSSRLSNAGKVASVPWKICRNCDFAGEAQEFRPKTVFVKITSTPQTLASEIVYSFHDCDGQEWWTSPLCNHTQWEKREEAITATIKELEKKLK